MSFDALAWAAKQRPGNLAAKMALLALANYANEVGDAYPSTAAIAEFGDMNHKTATAALDRLEALGLIADTGQRRGKSGQIKVYRLRLESLPKVEASQKRKPPTFSGKAPQKRGTDTVREPVKRQTHHATVIADDWKPADFPGSSKSREVVDGWPPGEVDAQLEHFTAHHRAKGSRFKDWQDAWSTWVLNSRRFRGRNHANDRKSSANPNRGRDGFLNACYEAAAGQAGNTFPHDG